MDSNMISIGISAAESAELLVASIEGYAIYVLDPGGNIATWNPGAERIKGYSASEIIGRHFSLFYTPEDRGGRTRARAAGGAPTVATKGGLARPQGRQPILGQRRDHAAARSRGDLPRVREGHARLDRAAESRRAEPAGAAGSRRDEDSGRVPDRRQARARFRAVTTIRAHLASLDAALRPLDDRAAAAVKAKATTIEWSLERIVRSMNNVVALAEEATQRLSSTPR